MDRNRRLVKRPAAGEESGWAGRPASTLADSWSYGAHDQTYPNHALPNLMIGNHDLVRFGDLLQRVGLANPTDPEYWARHRLAFMVQGAYSGPITRYYGEEIGDELPGYANRVTSGCASLGLCDDHVARTSAKILGVTIAEGDLSTDQHELLEFHRRLMTLRSQYPALSHGSRQHLHSDQVLYVDLKAHGDQEVVFAMNLSDEPMAVQLNANLFASTPPNAWDLLGEVAVDIVSGYLSFTLEPLSGKYILLAEGPTGLAGDYNVDGAVDAVDYAVWREALGQMGVGHAADGDASGVVDSGDFAIWQDNFGAVLAVNPSTAAPEPGAMLLLAMVGVVPVLRRRGALRGL